MSKAFSIRARLTLWYFALTSVALCIFGLASFGALQFALLKLKHKTLLRREERLLHFLQQNAQGGTPLPFDEQLRSYVLVAHEGNLFQIRDEHGALFFPLQPDSADWLSHPPATCARRLFVRMQPDGQPAAVLCHDELIGGRHLRLYIGSLLEDSDYVLGIYRKALLLLLPCLMVIAAVSGYHLSKRAMRPVDRMTRAALDMGIGNLSARLPEPEAQDELWSLAAAWNQLLGRLEQAVLRLTQFSADASHDLRTSITVVLATAELALRRPRSSEEYRDSLGRIVNECRTASTLLDALLSLARSDNFVHESAFTRINTAELVVAACRRVEDLAESSGIVLDWRLPERDVFVIGDELLLQRLLGILLDNAIKYTPECGEIVVDVRRSSEQVLLSVRDTGVGMSSAVQQQVFDRFYQADLRERKAQAGSGLGLSIAKWIAEAHRATLSVESTPAMGSTFQICFPVTADMGDAPSDHRELLLVS